MRAATVKTPSFSLRFICAEGKLRAHFNTDLLLVLHGCTDTVLSGVLLSPLCAHFMKMHSSYTACLLLDYHIPMDCEINN